MMELFSELKLNDKQQRQVDEVREGFQKKMREAMEQVRESGDREKMREAREKNLESLRKEMKEILTAEQYKKFDDSLKNLPSPMGRPRPE
jgi:Spy/CpxP family protein refolding chaperone